MGLSGEENQSDNRRQTPKSVVINAAGNSHEDASEVAQGSPARTAHRHRKGFRRSQHHFSPRDRRRKLHGVRQLRRCENLNYLLSQAEKDEDESGEVDFVDLVSDHNSAFQELFVEQEKMSAWMAFIDSSEEEQQKILSSVNKVKLRDVFNSLDDVNDDEEDDEFENITDVNDKDTPQPYDAAGQNFVKTANECFMRINRNLRTFLRRNRFPAGELQHLEDELVAFFVEWPASVYVAQLPDGYRRLMLHAVSQYLDLDAHSFDVPGCRTRQTHVENNRGSGDFFSPPPTPLATFIHDKKLACPIQV